MEKLAQRRRRVTRHDERDIFESQYVAFQPSLDGTHIRMSGRLGPLEGEVCRKALNQRGEDMYPAGEARPEAGLRRALALTTMCQDELDQLPPVGTGSGDHDHGRRREPLLMVVADQTLAEESGYEQGASVFAGGRVGPDTIDLIRCSGRVERITVNGQHITTHRTKSTIRPAMGRAVLARDGGCTIAGCNSTYRLEVHHILEASRGGDHTPDNLTTLCWWHHHVAIHRQGMKIDPLSPPHRRRLTHPRHNRRHQPPPVHSNPEGTFGISIPPPTRTPP